MPKVIEKPKVPQGTILDNMEYHDILKENVANLTKQKQGLNQQIVLSGIELRNNQEMIIRQKQEFETWRYRETKKTEEEKTKTLSFLIQQKDSLRHAEENISRRLRELSEREILIKKVEDERKEIRERMLGVEKLSSKIKIELQNAAQIKQVSEGRLAFIASKEKEVNEKLIKVESLNGNLNTKEEKLKSYEQELDAKLKNVEEVRSFIEPKLKELKTVEDNNKKLLEEIKTKEALVQSRITEDKSIVAGLEDRKNKLDEKERQLNSLNEEVTRKSLLLKEK